ncbi:MAG TPA: outer membrane beta-barrel protein [Terriglobales bacterium]|nr:outer membrane beta-barrel protein [Terriglobales bacterium]
MLRKLALLWAFLSIFSVFAHTQEEAPKAEIFGGYQYLHANTGISGASSFNFNGWNAAVNGYFTRNVGITADFSGNYGTVASVSTRIYSYLFGPVVRFPNSSRVTPFVHGLFGGAHVSFSQGGGSDTGFAWAAGGGLDIHASSHVAIRLGQFDFLQSRTFNLTQNNFRYSAGIVS